MKENRHRPLAGRLVIATGNPGKLAEMRQLLSPYRVEAVSASELGLREPEETGASFRENAGIKAQAAAAAARLPAFSYDSGLAVDALGGAPGIHSARWAGEDRNFMRAMGEIERQLESRGARSPWGRMGPNRSGAARTGPTPSMKHSWPTRSVSRCS